MAKRPFILSTKICKSCCSEKQITEFYHDSRGGFLPRCKSCHRNWIEARANRREKPLGKRCKKCGEQKTAEQFYSTSDGRLFACCKACEAVKRAENPEPHRKRCREWRKKNPEQAHKSCQRSRLRRLSKDPEYERRRYWNNVEENRKRQKQSRHRHKAKRNAESKAYRAANIDRCKAYLSAYWKANPEKAAEYHHRRRARKLNAAGSHTAADIKDIRRLQRDRCAICKTPLRKRGSVDHIKALVNGGGNDRRNLQLLCKSCNSKKRASDSIEHMQSLGYLL